jgi:hypothetical protein
VTLKYVNRLTSLASAKPDRDASGADATVASKHSGDYLAARCPEKAINERGEVSLQLLTLRLDGITADDYLCWARDPEPPALGRELCSITVEAPGLGDLIKAELCWRASPPPAADAARAAGFLLTPEVVRVVGRVVGASAGGRWQTPPISPAETNENASSRCPLATT